MMFSGPYRRQPLSGGTPMTIDLPTPVRAAIDAANANDTDAFLACFPPDGVVDDWGR